MEFLLVSLSVFHGVSSQTHSLCALLGDTDQKEMTPGKKIPVFVDGVVLNGPQTDVKAGEKFVEEACRLIMEEVVLKATNVNEKVKRKHTGNPRSGAGEMAQWRRHLLCKCEALSSNTQRTHVKLGTVAKI